MSSVEACPTNQFEINSASLRRNCSKDDYKNNQYMCIPNKEKTSLVEFCHEGNLKLIDEGNCLEVSKDKIIQHSCSHFSFGCPNVSFHYDEIQKFPACQNINTEAQCYVSDPSCPTQASTDNLSNYNFTSTFTYLPQTTTEEIKNLTESNIGETDSHIALSYILIMVVLIAVIAITCFCKRKKEKDKLKRRGQDLLENGNNPRESEGQHLLENGNNPRESEEGDNSVPGQDLFENGNNPRESEEEDNSVPGQHQLENENNPRESEEEDNSTPDNSISGTEFKVISEEEYNTAQEVISGPKEVISGPKETPKNKYIGKICKTLIKEIENKDNTDRRRNVQETVDEEHMLVHFVHVKGVPDRDANDTGVSDRGISDTGVPDRDTNDTGVSDRGISNTGGADGNNTETVDTSGNVCKAMAVGDNNIAIVSATGKNNVVTAMAVGDNNIAIATAEGEDNVSEARAEGTRNEAVATSEGINVKHTAFAQGSDNKARSAAKLENMDTIRNIIDVIKSNTCRKGTQTEEETGVKDIAHIDTENRMEPIGQESEDDIEGNTTAT